MTVDGDAVLAKDIGRIMDGDGALASSFAHDVVRSVVEWLEGGRNPPRREKRSFLMTGRL